jgi:hypothetical protein
LSVRSHLAGVLAVPVLLLLGLWPLPPPALAAPALLEDLRYRIEILSLQNAARVTLTLKRLEPGRFTAEIIGETQGLVKLLSGGQRERLQTEMVWRNQRLQPLIYREESWRREKRRLKEYRFDYAKGRIELWEWRQGKGLTKKWQTDLTDQFYDPLSAFYNCRLGILGPTREGEISTIQGIPYPRPEAMEVRLGAEGQDGRQVMLSLINPVYQDSRGVVFAKVDEQLVPHQAWTTVSGITIRGWLLPESAVMAPGLPGLKAPEPAAARRTPGEALPATVGLGKSR